MTRARLKIDLALRCHRSGDLDHAERLYNEVLADDPDNAQAVHLRGVVQLQRGRPEAAVDDLGQAVAADDSVSDYHNRLAVALAALGRQREARRHYLRAIEIDPNHAEAHNNLGLLLAGDGDAAIAHYRQALVARPDFAEAHNNLGVALARLGKADEAIAEYRAALAVDPDYAEANNNLGGALMSRGELTEAVALFRRALKAKPDSVECHVNLADALLWHGAAEKAQRHAGRAIKLDPNSAAAHNSYGMALRQRGQLDAAIDYLRRAIVLDPALARARGNLAIALAERADYEQALAEAEAAIRGAPDSPELAMNLGMILLAVGRFEEGFDRYEARWDTRDGRYRARPFDAPLWQGDSLANKRILVWGEQGVGEEIMFASLISEVAARAEHCVIECDPRLVPLFARSFAGATVVARADPPDPALGGDRIDVHCPAGSLCRWLRPDRDSFAGARAYLRPDEARAAEIRARADRRAGGPKIGIAWRSVGPMAAFSASKSSPLALWRPLLCQPGVSFVNLQYGDCAEDLAAVEAELAVTIHQDPEVDQMRSLDDFAAQIAGLDLVITTSNTTAHMAGALGRPVWVLLPHGPDWRWQASGEESLWYPHVRLMRQPRPGDWAGLLVRAADALADWRRTGGR